jgi:hypothetical protein
MVAPGIEAGTRITIACCALSYLPALPCLAPFILLFASVGRKDFDSEPQSSQRVDVSFFAPSCRL